MHAHLRVNVRHLFSKLDNKLIHLLRSLTPEEWEAQTIAKKWLVKDVAAHLLDGNIRLLSLQRDKYFGEPAPNIKNDQELINWLNEMNATWVQANKRISPSVMILLHEATGPLTTNYYEMTDPDEEAIFAVSWAGEKVSKNWFHIAREYTEKWIHQQQIREAVNKPGILDEEFFVPFMDTMVLGLPHHFRKVSASVGTIIELQTTNELEHSWFLIREKKEWNIIRENDQAAHTKVIIPASLAWKLFSKSRRYSEVKNEITIEGDRSLGTHLLELVAVMA